MKTQINQNKISEHQGLIMIICCLIPLIIAGALFYLGFKNYAIFAIMLLCLVLHYILMINMHKKEATEENKKDICH